MKKIIALAAAAAICLALFTGCGSTSGTSGSSGSTGGSSAPGEWTPNRSITMLVPWSAGGGSDLAVRTLAPYLEKDLGVSITVVNSTGANGWIAWNELLKADPDGYTIAQMNIPTVYSGYLDPQQNRDENLDSFALVANEISDWGCLVVKAGDARFTDTKSFIEYGMSNELLAGDNGVGTNKHLLAESLMSQIDGLQLTEVHQSGWSDTYAALLGGHIDVGWGSIGETLQAYQDGEVDILCVFATERSSLLPDVPTFNEEMPEYNVTSPSDRGFALPAGVDQAVYDRWIQAMDNCINNPEFIARMAVLGQAVNYLGGDEYTAYAKEQEAQMATFSEILGWS
ncbi:tripartite tricarboxylate transporter substrate binding protein [Oscillibacter sp. GMB15532]|uniref:tripartite tricarboxylate transporter substrate binding protein n=1 Tax=Oscillibacter sp. GMB15532 TaxID=3230022 RepID=UPI0034DF270D